MDEQNESDQDLYLEDFVTYKGRINRANFRALNLLILGVSICVYFLPGIIIAIWEYFNRRKYRTIDFDTIGAIQTIGPYVYGICYFILAMFLLLISIKRMRDTGNPLWKLLIPIYNLKILYFEESKI